jgi:hypothetical protein
MNHHQGPQGYANQGYGAQGNMAATYAAPMGQRPSASLRKWSFGLRVTSFLVVLGSIIVMFASIAGAAAMSPESSDAAGAGMVVGILSLYGCIFLSMLFRLGAAIAHATWVSRIYGWLPGEQRYGAAGWSGLIAPSSVGWMFFIPYFTYYWDFVTNMGLADAMNRTASSTGVNAAPINRDSALWASVLSLLFWPVGVFMQHTLMKNIDSLAETIDLARQSGPGFNPGAYPGAYDASGMPPVGGFGG